MHWTPSDVTITSRISRPVHKLHHFVIRAQLPFAVIFPTMLKFHIYIQYLFMKIYLKLLLFSHHASLSLTDNIQSYSGEPGGHFTATGCNRRTTNTTNSNITSQYTSSNLLFLLLLTRFIRIQHYTCFGKTSVSDRGRHGANKIFMWSTENDLSHSLQKQLNN
jgi:hypothetical protein